MAWHAPLQALFFSVITPVLSYLFAHLSSLPACCHTRSTLTENGGHKRALGKHFLDDRREEGKSDYTQVQGELGMGAGPLHTWAGPLHQMSLQGPA